MFANWLQDELIAFQQQAGVSLEAASIGDLRFSDHLVLAFSTKELIGRGGDFPAEWLFIGPALERRPSVAEFPWDWLEPGKRHVLLTLGTINGSNGQEFFAKAVAAARQLSETLQMVVVAPEGMVEDVPSHILVLPSVPQLQLLPHMDVVICHAGHNTVCETLAHGIPLIVAPIRDDQPIIAQQVTNAGAGIRLKFGRVKPEDFVEALTAIFKDDSYRKGSKNIQKTFQTAGGTSKAVEALEQVAMKSSMSVAVAT